MRLHLPPGGRISLLVVHVRLEDGGEEGVVLQLAAQHLLDAVQLASEGTVHHVGGGRADHGQRLLPDAHRGGEDVLQGCAGPAGGVTRLGVLVQDGEGGVEAVQRAGVGRQAPDETVARPVLEEDLLAVDPGVVAVRVEARHDGADLVEADLRLLVGVRADVGLRVVVSEEHVVQGQGGHARGLGELSRDEQVGQPDEAQALVVEAVDVREDEGLHRRELVAPAALQPGERERLIEPEEVPDLLRPPLVLGEEVKEALDAQQLVDVVRLGVEDAPQDVLADARIRLDESLPEAPVKLLPFALQVDDDVRLQLPQPLFLLLGHPIPPPACAP